MLQGSRWRGWRAAVTLLAATSLVFATPAPLPLAQEAAPQDPAPAVEEAPAAEAPAAAEQEAAPAPEEPTLPEELTGPGVQISDPVFLNNPVVLNAANDLHVAMRIESDGTATFDADQRSGNDTGPNNGIVRVNDTVTYYVTYQSGSQPAPDTTLTMTFPKGMEITELPGFCGAGSAITPPTAGNPALPLSDNSWQELSEQTVTCVLGDVRADATENVRFTTKVLSYVHDGQTLTPQALSIAATGRNTYNADPGTLPSVDASARLMWDISKNGIASTPNTGYVGGPFQVPCPWETTKVCFKSDYPLVISGPAGAKGAMPAVGDIHLTDDLSPKVLFPALTPEQEAEFNANLERYGARLSTNTLNYHSLPGASIGGTNTAADSVRNSGNLTFNPAPLSQGGAVYNGTIVAPDMSLRTYPTRVLRPAGMTLPADKAFAVSHSFSVWVPAETVSKFGQGTSTSKVLEMANTFTNLDITGFNGVKQTSADQPLENDTRKVLMKVELGGSINKNFVGVPGEPNNMTNREFSSGWTARGEGPPGGGTLGSGNILAAPGQNIQTQILLKGSSPATNGHISYLVCDSWDNTRLYLRSANTPAGAQTPSFQNVPSGGAPVWVSGYNNVATGGGVRYATTTADTPALKVQYSATPRKPGDSGPQSECGDSAGPWYDDPAQVPGNDPAKLAEGLYTGVGRARFLITLPPPVTLGVPDVWATVHLNQQVAEWPGQATGDLIPNYAAGKILPYEQIDTFEAAVAHSTPWIRSGYDVNTHRGALGDRLTLVTAIARLNKTVRKEGVGAFSDTPPSLTGGEVVEFRLQPSLITGVLSSSAQKKEMWIEECLPGAAMYLSANFTPAVVAATTPADARLKCPAGATYLRWVFPEAQVNAEQPAVIYRAEVLADAKDGSYNLDAMVSAEGDASAANLRTNNAPFRVSNRVGVYLQKMALTPVLQVNPVGNTNHELNRWRVRLSNNMPPAGTIIPENVDIIDILPRVGGPAGGAETSRFSGTFTLDSVTVDEAVSNTATQTTRVLYTKAANPHQDAKDPSNLAGGSTAWCDAPAGGTLVMGTGDCPATKAEVTAVRVMRDGQFQVGQAIQFDIAMLAEGNVHDDVYVNRTAARADRVDFLVGPIDRPERAIGATLGDKVWLDANKDGIQDADEKPAVGVKVTLTGTDDLGNKVQMETRTDSTGTYRFVGLRASDASGYTVTFSETPAGTVFTAQTAGSDGAADSNADAQGVSAPVVLSAGEVNLTVDAGLVTTHFPIHVRKIEVADGSTGNQIVTLNYECTAEGVKGTNIMAARGTVEVVPATDAATATPTEIGLFPEGTSCAITGEDDQARSGWTLVTDFGQAAVAGADSAANPIQVTNTYTRKTGTIRVTKRFEGLGNYAAARLADKEITVNYTCDPGFGAQQLTGSITLNQAGGFAGTSPELPVGSACTLTEDTATAQVAGFELTGTTYSAPGGAVTVADTPGTPTELAVTNTYTQQFGSVELTKQVEVDGVVETRPLFNFLVRYTCTDGVDYNLASTMTFTSHGEVHRIENVPVGTTCTFTENDPQVELHSWAHDFSPSNVVTVGGTDPVALTLTNRLTRNRGSLVISKVVSGAAAGAVPADYEFRYSLVCRDANNDLTVTFPEITVRRGQQTVVDNVPAGLCDLQELNPEIPGTNVEVWRDHAYESRVDGPQAQINVAANQPYAITWENIYTPRRGSFEVRKQVSAPGYEGSIPQDKQFSFTYTCTAAYPGAPTMAGQMITGVTTTQAGHSPMLPVGTECTVEEVVGNAGLTGFSLAGPAPQTVTITEGAATQALTFDNTYTRNLGAVSVTKQVTGTAAPLVPADKQYQFAYTCYDAVTGGVSRTGTLQVAAGATETLADLPSGHCEFSEENAQVDRAELTTTVAVAGGDPTESVTARATVAAPGRPATEVVYTNEYTPVTAPFVVHKVVRAGEYEQLFEEKEFSFHYTCTEAYPGAGAVTGTIEGVTVLRPGHSQALPVGTECEITEDTATAAEAGFTWTLDGGQDPRRITVGEDPNTPVEVTFTNDYARELGSFTITKQVSGDAAGKVGDLQPPVGFTFRYTCTDLAGMAAISGEVTLGDGGSATLRDIPAGECVIEELPAPAVEHTTVATTVAVDGAPAQESNRAVVQVVKDAPVVTTAAFDNAYTTQLGTFTVAKTVTADHQAGLLAGKVFAFDYTCAPAYPGAPVTNGEILGVTVTNPGTSVALPIGTTCTVTERPDTAQQPGFSVAVPAPQRVTVGAGNTPVALSFANVYTRDRGAFTLTKNVVVDGQPAPDAGATFPVSYRCTDGAVEASGTVDVPGDGTPVTVADILVGSTCEVSEADVNRAGFTLAKNIDLPRFEITNTADRPAVTVTNTYTRDLGGFAITKEVAGDAAALVADTHEFEFTYTCRGEDGSTVGPNTVMVRRGQTVQVPDVPTGECELTETAFAPAHTTGVTTVAVDGAALDETRTATFRVTKDAADTVRLAYTNTYTAVTAPFLVNKTVAVDTSAFALSGKTFDFTYSCTPAFPGAPAPQGASISGVTVDRAGASVALPIGTTCEVQEAPAAVAGFTWTAPAAQQVTVGAGDQPVTVSFHNEYVRELGEFTVTKEVTGDATALAPAEYRFTYRCLDMDGSVSKEGEVTVAGGASATITGVPTGNCTVVEQDGSVANTTLVTQVAVNGGPATQTPTATVAVTANPQAPITVAYTNEYTAVRAPFVVRKEVTADHQAGLLAGKAFAFDYTCTPAYPGAFADGGALENVTAQQPGFSVALPIGTECEVTERPDTAQQPGFSVAVPAPQRVTVGAGNDPVEVTFANVYTRDRGAFTLTKNVVVDGQPAPDANATFPVSYRCTDGAAEATGTVDVPGDGTPVTVADILVGSTCEVSEGDVNRPGFTLAKSIDTPQFQVAHATDRPAVTVTNTYTRDLGGFSLTKEITGNAAAKVAHNQQFEFTYTCRGEDGVTVGPTKLLLTAGTTVQVADVPTGECDITETAFAPEHTTGVTTPIVDGQEQATGLVATFRVTKDVVDTAQVKFTNAYTADTAVFRVTKEVTADSMASVLAGKEFAFGYTCTPAYPGAFVPADGAITGLTVTEPGTSVELPIGTECQVTERPAAHPGFTWTAPQPQTVTVTAGQEPAGVTMANTYTRERGSFTVTKAVAGGAAALAPQEFRFSYVCTDLDGTQTAPVEITVPAGQSVTVDGIPTGDCQITEKDAQVPNTALATTWSVAQGDSQDGATGTFTVGANDTTPVAFTNTYEHTGAHVTLAKKVALWTAFAGSEYTFQYLCTITQDERIEGFVTVKGDGTPVQIEQVFPVGTTCEVAEDSDTAQRAGFLLMPPRAFAFTVREADAGQTLAFEATNTYIPWLGFLIPLIPLVVGSIPQATNPPAAVNPGQAQPSVVTDPQISKPAKGVVGKAQQAVKKLAQTGVADSLPLLALLGLLLVAVGGALSIRKKGKRS